MTEGSLEYKHIVVLDDNHHVLRMMEEILEGKNAFVHAYDNIFQARQYMQSSRVEGFITDIVIGKENGLTYLNELVESGEFVPTVIVSGSHASKQFIELFRQGYVLEGNNIPLALMLKEPYSFSETLVSRLEKVMKSKTSQKRIKEAFNVVRLAAQDQGVYELCTKVMDYYFSVSAMSLALIDEMDTEHVELLSAMKSYRDSFKYENFSFTEFLGMPTIALHAAATRTTQILGEIESILHLAKKHDEESCRNLEFIRDSFQEFGNYLKSARDGELISHERNRLEEENVSRGQMRAADWATLGSEKKIRPRKTPLDSFNVIQENKRPRILYAFEIPSTMRYFSDYSDIDIAGCYVQAINALASADMLDRRYDAVFVHLNLIYSGRRGGSNEALRISNYPDAETGLFHEYISGAKKNMKDYGQLDESTNAEMLAGIVRHNYPDTKIVLITGGNFKELKYFKLGFFDDNLMKPFSGRNVYSVMNHLFPELKLKESDN